MKYKIAVLLVFLGICAIAQSQSNTFWIWVSQEYPVWVMLGDSLEIKNNKLEVTVRDTYGVQLTYDAAISGWRLPTNARNVRVYVNGLRYIENIDYTLSSEILQAKGFNMGPNSMVVIDYVN